MARQREWEEQWLRIVSLLQYCRGSVAMSLTESQQLFDATPDLALPPAFAQSVVSQVLHNRSEQWQSSVRSRLGDLVFSLELSPPPTESMVYDVSPGFHALGRSEFRRVRQGTVLSDAYLDGRGLDACQFGSRYELWCDGTDHEQDSMARIRDN
jgi:hypothetical protein